MSKLFATFEESRAINPERTEQLAQHAEAWKVILTKPDGTQLCEQGTDVVLAGPTGTARLVVLLRADGMPMYEHLVISEIPRVVMVVWGRDADTTIKIGTLATPGRVAEHPIHVDEGPLFFHQLPESVMNDSECSLPVRVGIARTAARECYETHMLSVRDVEVPPDPFIWRNPSLINTPMRVAFVEVNLPAAKRRVRCNTETSAKLAFLTVPELRMLIADGEHAHSLSRSASTTGALMLFFALHPKMLMEGFQDDTPT